MTYSCDTCKNQTKIVYGYPPKYVCEKCRDKLEEMGEKAVEKKIKLK